MRVKRELKRSLLAIMFLLVGATFLALLLSWDMVGIIPRKLFLVAFSILIIHFLRKTIFYYFDIEKEFLEAKKVNPAIAFLGMSIILGLIIFGLFLVLAFIS